jgi:hypothetical protein
MGTDALGYLIYTADGRFSVMISRAGRPGFAANDLFGGTIPEQARAVEGFMAYAGRYSFHGDRVVHHVLRSVEPLTPQQQAMLLTANLPTVEKELNEGAIAVLDRRRLRVRPSRSIVPTPSTAPARLQCISDWPVMTAAVPGHVTGRLSLACDLHLCC